LEKNRAKPEKTEPNRKNRVKPEKIKSNQFEPVFVLKNQTETGWFEPVLVFLKKLGLVIFFL
jgi:hypothetical protein